MRRAHRLMTALPVALLLAASGGHAQQNYPTKPIRLVVPFAPGGPTDIVARTLAQKLTETFKQTVVVDNRSGGGGTIGSETAVKANPDGYTMLFIAGGAYAANAALYKLPYDPVNNVAPVALISESGFVVALHPSVPIKNTKELIAYDKANPGKLNYGSGGTGSASHLGTELFNQMAGTKLTHVPYKGGGPALNDLLGAQIQLMLGGFPQVFPHIKLNRLRGISVTTAKRSSAAPDIPTVGETVAGYEVIAWYGVLGPKGLSKDIVGRWNSEINRVLQLHDMKERIAGDGMEPGGGSPERVGELLKRDVAKWQRVIKVGGIKPGS